MIFLGTMMMMSFPSIFHEYEKLQNSLLEVLQPSHGNLIESNEIIKNFVALKEKEKEWIKRS
jgi:hypothetical protein